MSRRKAISFDKRRVHGPPQNEPWCWMPRSLLESPAWRARSIHCARFIEFLVHEHISHAGMENGALVAPYAQLAAWGVGRRYIKDAIAEAVGLRLVVAQRGGLRAHSKAAMTRFRLTFYHTKEDGNGLHAYWAAPSDEWRRVTADDVRQVIAARPARNPKKQNAGAHGVTTSGYTVEPVPVHTVEPVPDEKARISAETPLVTPCALPSISSVRTPSCDPPASLWLRLLAGSSAACALLTAAGHRHAAGKSHKPTSLRKLAVAKSRKSARRATGMAAS